LISQEGGRSAEVTSDTEESVLIDTQSPEASDTKGHLKEKSDNMFLTSDAEDRSSIQFNTQSPEPAADKIGHLQEKIDSMSLNDIVKSSPGTPKRNKNGKFSRRNSSVKEKIRDLNLKKGIVISPTSQSRSGTSGQRMYATFPLV
jgi:hypothetical protein